MGGNYAGHRASSKRIRFITIFDGQVKAIIWKTRTLLGKLIRPTISDFNVTPQKFGAQTIAMNNSKPIL